MDQMDKTKMKQTRKNLHIIIIRSSICHNLPHKMNSDIIRKGFLLRLCSRPEQITDGLKGASAADIARHLRGVLLVCK